MFVVVSGEYTGSLGGLNAAIRKLHPGARQVDGEQQGGYSCYYSIEERLNGHLVRLSARIEPGKAFDSREPCYDVHLFGSSFNGNCRQFIDAIVYESGIRVIHDTRVSSRKNGSSTLQELVDG